MSALTLFDGHVHIHKKADVAVLLSAAMQNFAAAAAKLTSGPWRGALLLTEMGHRNWFEEMAARSTEPELGSWRIASASPDGINLRALGPDGAELTIVAGRQIITSERIEVLALATRARIEDGASLESTITQAQGVGALVVLPWGAGKWLGHRGKLVQQALGASRLRPVFAGDNRGRARGLRQPASFAIAQQRGSPILPGTDPLALPGEERHVGSFGFAIAGPPTDAIEGRSLQERLSGDPAGVRVFGRRVGLIQFARNQAALRIRGERYP